MMTSLFSTFDPSLSLLSSSWLVLFFFLLLLPAVYWIGGILAFSVSSVNCFIMNEVGYALRFTVNGCYIFVISIFFTVSLYNFLALFPFIFSVTSHMLATLPFSFSLWLGIVFFSLASSLKYFFSHLIPLGTPIFLVSFMVLVEVLSNLIRPLALTFRLTANIIAGHLLLSLIGGGLVYFPFSGILIGSLVQSFLVLIELGVSFIQAYVFSTLLLLYLSESGD